MMLEGFTFEGHGDHLMLVFVDDVSQAVGLQLGDDDVLVLESATRRRKRDTCSVALALEQHDADANETRLPLFVHGALRVQSGMSQDADTPSDAWSRAKDTPGSNFERLCTSHFPLLN